jgi:glycosyltransferase involved in cell wall biosynthesis
MAIPKPTPLITVFIPTYNRLEFLKKAVNSVFNCKAHVHLHVLDNCSTDGSDEWLNEISSDAPISVEITRQTHNIGSLANYAAGFDSVRTPFLVPLADDDELVPGFLSKALKKAIKHPDAIAIVGSRAYVKNGDWHADWDSRRSVGLVSPQVNVEEFLRYGHHVTWSAIVWRSDVIQSNKIFIRAAQYGLPSDVYFQFAAFSCGPVYVEPLPAATFNSTPGQSSSKIGLSIDSIRDYGKLANSLYRECLATKIITNEDKVKELLAKTVQGWANSIQINRNSAIQSGQKIDLEKTFAEYVLRLFPYCGFNNFPFISEILALESSLSFGNSNGNSAKKTIRSRVYSKLKSTKERILKFFLLLDKCG